MTKKMFRNAQIVLFMVIGMNVLILEWGVISWMINVIVIVISMVLVFVEMFSGKQQKDKGD